MISRYQIKEVEDIFSLESRYNYFLKVELAVIKAYVTLGTIPEEDYLKRFERCFELLNNISEQINNKPINVEILNHDLTEYKALKEDLFINIDNCQSIINEIDRRLD